MRAPKLSRVTAWARVYKEGTYTQEYGPEEASQFAAVVTVVFKYNGAPVTFISLQPNGDSKRVDVEVVPSAYESIVDYSSSDTNTVTVTDNTTYITVTAPLPPGDATIDATVYGVVCNTLSVNVIAYTTRIEEGTGQIALTDNPPYEAEFSCFSANFPNGGDYSEGYWEQGGANERREWADSAFDTFAPKLDAGGSNTLRIYFVVEGERVEDDVVFSTKEQVISTSVTQPASAGQTSGIAQSYFNMEQGRTVQFSWSIGGSYSGNWSEDSLTGIGTTYDEELTEPQPDVLVSKLSCSGAVSVKSFEKTTAAATTSVVEQEARLQRTTSSSGGPVVHMVSETRGPYTLGYGEGHILYHELQATEEEITVLHYQDTDNDGFADSAEGYSSKWKAREDPELTWPQ